MKSILKKGSNSFLIFFLCLTSIYISASQVARNLMRERTSTLIEAIKKNDFDLLKNLFQDGVPESYNSLYGGFTPLNLASHLGNLQTVEYLLSNKANIHENDGLHRNALYWAAQNVTDQRILGFLVSKGISITATDHYGTTALHMVVNCHYARILLENGANINARDRSGITPLIRIINDFRVSSGQASKLRLIKFLLQEGADTMMYDSAQVKIQLENLGWLGDNKEFEGIFAPAANWLIAFSENRIPLFLAVQSGDLISVKRLAQKISINIKDNDGNTPLHVAVKYLDKAMVQLLLSMKANPCIKNKSKETPVHLAVGTEILSVFIQTGFAYSENI